MNKINSRLVALSMVILLAGIALPSCGEEDDLAASVSINETGSDFGEDVNGAGGTTQESFTWNNPLRSVDWNMDITAASGGSFNLSIADAEGNNVLDQTITVGQGDDSRSGVSAVGPTGEWTITVTLNNFSGDGSFSISPGD